MPRSWISTRKAVILFFRCCTQVERSPTVTPTDKRCTDVRLTQLIFAQAHDTVFAFPQRWTVVQQRNTN
eukprot:9486582-Pyramimonas_sp.AAC.1